MNSAWLVGVRLFLICLVPITVSILFFLLQKKTRFGNLSYKKQQVIIGIVFGLVAIFGTEVGVPLEGATANARDAGPLCAGLIFGGPAGIIAGVIGGLERWFAVYWGAGTYTRVACSLSTMLAGVYAAILRKYMFNNENPNFAFGFFIGGIMEVIHLVVLLFTKIAYIDTTIALLKILSLPMVFAGAFAVGVSCLFIDLIKYKRVIDPAKENMLAYKIQKWLLLTVVIAFLIITGFIYIAQTNSARKNYDDQLTNNINDVVSDIKGTTDDEIKATCRLALDKYLTYIQAHGSIDSYVLHSFCTELGLDEIDIIEETLVNNQTKPIIVATSKVQYLGFDMSSTEQANSFNVLLKSSINHVDYLVQNARPNSSGIIMKYAGVSINDTSYIQIGYRNETFQQTINNRVKYLTNTHHIGQSGIIIIADMNGVVVSMTGVEELTLTDMGIDVNQFKTSVYYYDDVLIPNKGIETCMFKYVRNDLYYIFAIIPKAEVMSQRDAMLYITGYTEIIILASLFGVVFTLCKKLVIEKITSTNSKLDQITNGNLNIVANAGGSKELESLSDGINKTVDALKLHIEKEKHRLDKELEFAKNIQLSALPKVYPAFPDVPSIDVKAMMFTAKEVGGDFYDYYLLGKNRVGFLVADVSGKGVPAAMFMMQSKATIKDYAQRYSNVNEILEHANVEICKQNDAEMFVTCWMGICDLDTGVLHFTSAGHNPPLIYRKATNTFEYINSKVGFVLAGLEFSKYKEEEIKLNPGDKIFLYTDGVTEATRIDNVLYGEERLQDYLNHNSFRDINSILSYLKEDIDSFIEGADQFDDITMMMFEYKGPNNN